MDVKSLKKKSLPVPLTTVAKERSSLPEQSTSSSAKGHPRPIPGGTWGLKGSCRSGGLNPRPLLCKACVYPIEPCGQSWGVGELFQ